MKNLIAELNDMLARNAKQFAALDAAAQREFVLKNLSRKNADVFASLPEGVARQLTLDRDPPRQRAGITHRNRKTPLRNGRQTPRQNEKKKAASTVNSPHSTTSSATKAAAPTPSNFDADYCYALGYNAACLINAGVTGYMSTVRNLSKPVVQWQPGGIPITMMMNMERRNDQLKPVIQKALVRLDGAPFLKFASKRDQWAVETCYMYPVPSSTSVPQKYATSPP